MCSRHHILLMDEVRTIMAQRNHRKTLKFLDKQLKVLKHVWLLICKDEICNGRHVRAQSPPFDSDHKMIAKCIYCGKKNMTVQRLPIIGVNQEDK